MPAYGAIRSNILAANPSHFLNISVATKPGHKAFTTTPETHYNTVINSIPGIKEKNKT